MLLREALDGHDVHFATTSRALLEHAEIANGRELPDCNQHRIGASLRCAVEAARLLTQLRPHIVISTGAAPGLFCLAFGKLTGARTIWVDSLANAERLSLSGQLAGWVADLWLTQWRNLARPHGPTYEGELL